MHARRTSSRWMAVMVRALTLALWRGAALPRDMAVDPIPVEGVLSPDGRFVGTLTLATVTVADAGRLRLTGALHGTATRRTGATPRVPHQTFAALAVSIDAEQTTDVVLVKMAPMALASGGRQLTLAPIPLDIEAVPDERLLVPTLLNEAAGDGRGVRAMG